MSSQHTDYHKITPETAALRNAIIKDKFECETWKTSKLRNRMFRLKMYSMKQESFINRDGEESVCTYYPAFSADEIEQSLNRKQERFLKTGDPAYLHDWTCSSANGCSEKELRETILDLRVAEQSYPERKQRRKQTYYVTDDEGFTKKIKNKPFSSKKKNRSKQSNQTIIFSNFKTKNIFDLSDM